MLVMFLLELLFLGVGNYHPFPSSLVKISKNIILFLPLVLFPSILPLIRKLIRKLKRY